MEFAEKVIFEVTMELLSLSSTFWIIVACIQLQKEVNHY